MVILYVNLAMPLQASKLLRFYTDQILNLKIWGGGGVIVTFNFKKAIKDPCFKVKWLEGLF